MKITVELDLTTCEGRAAMRAWLDATEPQEVARRPTKETLARPLAAPWTPSTPFAAPAEPVGQGVGSEATDPAPALVIPGEMRNDAGVAPGADVPPPPVAAAPPLDPDPPAPPPTPAPVDHDELTLDPKRPWTDEDRRQAEVLNATAGLPPPKVARRLNRDPKQVANYIYAVRKGVIKSRLPAVSDASMTAEDDYRRPPVMAAEKVAAMRAELHERRCAREVREALYASRA